MNKSLLVITLTCAMLPSLFGRTLNIPLSEIPILEPHRGNDFNMNKVLNQVAESLVRLD